LLKHTKHELPELQKKFAPYKKLYDHHPYHFVRTENKAVRMPVYEEFLQMHTNACTFDPRQWKSYANKSKKNLMTQHNVKKIKDGNFRICHRSLDSPAPVSLQT